MAQSAGAVRRDPEQSGEPTHEVLIALLEEKFRRLRLGVDKENAAPVEAAASLPSQPPRVGRRALPPLPMVKRRSRRLPRKAALILQSIDPNTATDIKPPSYADVLAHPAPSGDDDSMAGIASPTGIDGHGRNGGQNGERNGGWGHLEDHGVVGERPAASNGVHGRRFSESAVTRLGIRWAPWDIPLPRRMQTLAVWCHTYSIFFSTATFFFCCANPLLWVFLFPYVLYLLYLNNAPSDGKLSWRSERFRSSFVWRLFADYFPAQLYKTADLPADRKYIFGYHPHGIISHGAFTAFGTDALGFKEKFPGIVNSLLTLDIQFLIPFHREWLLKLGISSVSKESIYNHLTKGGSNGRGLGRAVTIVIGGSRESLERQRGHDMNLVLRNRRGFVKQAIRAGADLVPVMCFGEMEIYDQVDGQRWKLLGKFQRLLIKFARFTLPIIKGRGILNYDYGLMPRRRPLHIVVGRPIRIEWGSDEHDSPERVKQIHQRYCDELQRLFDTYKSVFGPGEDAQLHFLG